MRFALLILTWCGAVGSLIWLFAKLRKHHVPDEIRLAQWARKKGVDIVSSQHRWLLRGPFFAMRGPTVYRVTIRERDGTERDGWIGIVFRIPGFETEVEWIES